jgi:sugar O-acyltransferase (sialic acid O-acetyltransferase NeuD family)
VNAPDVIPIVILGGPGDGVVVAEAVLDMAAGGQPVRLAGFLNDALPVGARVHHAEVLGTLEDWPRLDPATRFIAALHKVKRMEERAQRIASLAIPDERYISVFHPSAVIARDVEVGAGSFFAAHVVVQPGSYVGRHVSVRAGANLGHDSRVEDFCYIGPNATLCGRTVMGAGAHLGPNSVVADGQRVGRYSVVGVCSAVTKTVPDRAVCLGVPARVFATLAPVPERKA